MHGAAAALIVSVLVAVPGVCAEREQLEAMRARIEKLRIAITDA